MRVKIDGEETTLTFQSVSGSRGFDYHTPGHSASHCFNFHPAPGQKFRTNGHAYEILRGDHAHEPEAGGADDRGSPSGS